MANKFLQHLGYDFYCEKQYKSQLQIIYEIINNQPKRFIDLLMALMFAIFFSF